MEAALLQDPKVGRIHDATIAMFGQDPRNNVKGLHVVSSLIWLICNGFI
jgi:hypothetical protein